MECYVHSPISTLPKKNNVGGRFADFGPIIHIAIAKCVHQSEPCVRLCRLRVPPGNVPYIRLFCTYTKNISTDVDMSLTCIQKVEGKSADLDLSFILFSQILYTNSGSFRKCVVQGVA